MRTLLAILMLLALTTAAAHAAPSRDCLSQAQAAKVYPGQFLKYREVGSLRCWFAGRTPDKSEFKITPASAGPPDARATTPSAQREQAATVERLRAEVEALRRDVAVATAKAEEKQGQVAQRAQERKAAEDDLVGLEGTLCPGPCEDLRTIEPKELSARLEAAHAAFLEYWTTFNARWALPLSGSAEISMPSAFNVRGLHN
jgi:hypothetical protein